MIALLLALGCVLANAFFVAAEFALAKVRPTALEALAAAGDASAARALAITKHLDAYLTATQFGITLASLGLGWLGEPAVAGFIEPPLEWLHAPPAVVHGAGTAIAFVFITVLHIVVGELVPKSFALQRPEAVASGTSRAMQLFYWSMYPFLRVLNGFSNLVLRAAGLPAPENAEGTLSLEELRLLVRATVKDGDSAAEKKRDLMERVLRSTDRPVRSVMVPRVDIVTLSLDDDFDHVVEEMRKHAYSRYPVTESGDRDRIVGYFYVKDVLLARERPKEGLRAFRRDVLFVPGTKTVAELLAELQGSRTPIAVVVDEYGGTSGLVTLEDLVEEIVGDIQDELDVEHAPIQRNEDGSVSVDASVPLAELALDGLVLDQHDEHDTVGAYVVGLLGRLAQPGDRVRIGRWDAVVDVVRRRRVGRVTFRARPATQPPPTTA